MSDNIADWIELDRPNPAASAPADDEPITPIELDGPALAPAEPAWLTEARAAIQAAPTRAALNAVCGPMLAWPEERKVLIRPIRDARWAELTAAGGTPARGVAVMAATATVAAAPVVATAAPTPAITAPTEPTLAPAAEGRPMVAAWRQITTGPHAGQWGAAVEHIQYGVAIDPPRVGDVLIVNRARGGASQRKRVTGIVSTSAARGGFTVCTVADPGTDERATLARPRTVAPTAPAATAPAPIASEAQEPAPVSSGLASLATVDAGLAESLGAVAAEGAANAAVAPLGSIADGSMRGVGFRTPEQHLEALRRGGLQAHTREEYLRIVRRAGLTFTEAEIPPPNATPILPSGPGILHRGNTNLTTAQRAAGLRVGRAAEQVQTGGALLTKGDLIAGSIVGGAGGDFSWAGCGQITRAALIRVLTEIGREGDAPAAKNARAQAGRAVDTLRPEYHVHAVSGAERKSLPPHVAHRYIVGQVSAVGATPTVGAEYGRRVLVVDLYRDDTLHWEGDANLAARVVADYEARTQDDIYISADLTAWLQRTLIKAHGATRFGVGWYVPAGDRAEAERLTRAVAKIWGESWRHGMPVAACAPIFAGLIEGLSDELGRVQAEWATAKEAATSADKSADKLDVGRRRAAGILARLGEVSERIRGYSVLLGEPCAAQIGELRATVARLDGEIRPHADDVTSRASMLEFS